MTVQEFVLKFSSFSFSGSETTRFSHSRSYRHPDTLRPPTLVSAFALSLFCLAMTTSANAQTPANAAPPQEPAELRVLDIENRRIVTSEREPSEALLYCDVLIIGGGVGGVAAAEAAAKRGVSVILVEPTRFLGGQLTTQLVPVPDENRFIEEANGPSTASYRVLRERVRKHYEGLTIPGREKNVGSCWVSRVSATPDIWITAIDERMYNVGLNAPLRIYRRHQLRNVGFRADGKVSYADIVNLDTGKVSRIGTEFFLDATEDGNALHLAGLPTALGQEAKGEYNEPHAPDAAHPEWVQSFTYCFMVRWQTPEPHTIITKPQEYDYFKSLGEYTLDYVYSDARGIVPYKVLTKAPNAAGPFWTYRRLRATDSYRVRKSPEEDISLINWRGNDFHEESYIGKPLEEQVRILNRGAAFAQGFLHWLQTECPRDEGNEVGYPEMQQVTGKEWYGLGTDGLAIHPYVRESRRLKPKFMLTENHLLAPPDNPKAEWGEVFPDSVGCALYAIDIHPSKGEPPLLTAALPYHIPLGSFLTASGPVNVIPAAKNFGATRLALASARMHPTEWLIGEVAGSLAAFCRKRNIADPGLVRETPDLLSAFQSDLKENGVTLYWSEIIKPKPMEGGP